VEGILAETARYRVVGTGSSAGDIISVAETLSPDVMIVDLSMPGDVFAAMTAVTGAARCKVVVFTAYDRLDLARRALDAGAQGFVLKGRPSEDLTDAIDAVCRNEVYISADVATRLHASRRPSSVADVAGQRARLSPREQQLVQCLLEAKSNKEIARTLNLSEKTVKHYMTNLMSKLAAKSRVEVVLAVQAARLAQDAESPVPTDDLL
jgi:DNA-binding NarL/FixJ family response regulator